MKNKLKMLRNPIFLLFIALLFLALSNLLEVPIWVSQIGWVGIIIAGVINIWNKWFK